MSVQENSGAFSTGQVKLGDIVDVLEREGESLVLANGMIHRLSPPATLILQRANAGWIGVPELVVALVTEFGDPPDGDADALTRDMVDALIEAHLLKSRNLSSST
ncbi:hypothetical protein K0651_12550 [Ornithinimicrobium sp. Arc0846-15]|nr:hypothetical protein [Ornithinimicrobium laminariae]